MSLARLLALAFVMLAATPTMAADLFPFTMPWNDTGDGGVTDLSSWNDKPAGRAGFVRVDGSHLMAGDQRLRFLGVNIVFGSTAPVHDDADILARRLARFGVNVVRFHHMESSVSPRGILQKDRTTLDPVMMERLDYFIAALKREGIYADLNLHVGRLYPGMGEIWADGPQYWKGVDHFYPAMLAQQKQYARDLLTHVNPYTGHAYTDEPAVALIEINNENGLIREWRDGKLDGMTDPFRAELGRQWRQWLTARYHDDKGLATAWGVASEPLGAEMLTPTVGVRGGAAGWNLQVIGDAKASASATPAGLSLDMTAKGAQPWHIQLHQNRLKFAADRAYTLTLRLRADHPLTLGVIAMQAHEPWSRLWSDKVKVGTEWRDVHLTFAPTSGDTVARLTLGEVGQETGKLEIAGASLKPGGVIGLEPGESLATGTLGMLERARFMSRTKAAQRDWLTFLWETEERYWGEMQRVVKDEIGAKPLVVGTQVSYSPGTIQAAMDVVDGHAYWQHPQFPGKPWDMDNWLIRQMPMAGLNGTGTLADLALRRVPGKPFIVTEYNHPAPSFYQGEAMPLAAAYGALQDWDGLFLYSFGAHDHDWHTDYIDNFFDSRANPVKLASLLPAAAALRRGDVAAAAADIRPMPPRADWIEALRREARIPGAEQLGAPRNAAVARWVSAATPAGEPVPLPITSTTGQLTWGRDGVGGKTVTIDTEKSKALIGARLGQTFDAHGVGLEVTEALNDWAVLTATVVDGKDFASPGRILVTALGQEENTDQHWLDAAKTTLGRRFGKAPVLVEGIGAKLTLPVAAARVSAWALDERGHRRDALPVTGGDRATVTLSPAAKTLWYEVEVR
jgi:hypothetical protein